jgi:DNA-directed RNA polymerase subunit L
METEEPDYFVGSISKTLLADARARKRKLIAREPTLDEYQDERYQTQIFVLHAEDHTIANLLREEILKQPDTEYVAYTIPDPLVSNVHLTIKTKLPTTPEVMLKCCLGNLKNIHAQIRQTFLVSRTSLLNLFCAG